MATQSKPSTKSKPAEPKKLTDAEKRQRHFDEARKLSAANAERDLKNRPKEA